MGKKSEPLGSWVPWLAATRNAGIPLLDFAILMGTLPENRLTELRDFWSYSALVDHNSGWQVDGKLGVRYCSDLVPARADLNVLPSLRVATLISLFKKPHGHPEWPTASPNVQGTLQGPTQLESSQKCPYI